LNFFIYLGKLCIKKLMYICFQNEIVNCLAMTKKKWKIHNCIKGSLNTIILEVAGGEMVRCMGMKSLKSKGITQANSILRRRFVSTLLAWSRRYSGCEIEGWTTGCENIINWLRTGEETVNRLTEENFIQVLCRVWWSKALI
jgi:hypothetical protein